MKLAIFAKKKTTKDGRAFYAYVSKLQKKDGTEVTAGVKFREECGSPKAEECPCYILVDKNNANLSTRNMEYITEDGEVKEYESKTLWVNAWEKSPEKYVDTSLDDFED